MKSKKVKWLSICMAGVLAVGCLTGCGKETEDGQKESTPAAQSQNTEADVSDSNESASGKLVLVGSTSMEKVANALKESFMDAYPDVTVNVEFGGSTAGIEALIAGSADIGNSSRSLKEDELSQGVVENVIAIDGIAVIVNNGNSVANLTKDELISIYTGEVTNWSAFGGDSEPIVVVGREAGSGTRGAFEELLGIEDACTYANELDSTGAVLAKVASTEGAIGYVSLDVVDDTVTSLELDGVAATEDNIKAGDYFLCRPFVMATMGEISEQSDLVQQWFAYLESQEGQDVIKGAGLILP